MNLRLPAPEHSYPQVDLAEESLIYLPHPAQALALSPSTTTVWRACCEGFTYRQTETLLQEQFQLDATQAQALLGEGLRVLIEHKLLPAHPTSLSRRTLLSAAVMPTILVLVAPTAAAAASSCSIIGNAGCQSSFGNTRLTTCEPCSPAASPLECNRRCLTAYCATNETSSCVDDPFSTGVPTPQICFLPSPGSPIQEDCGAARAEAINRHLTDLSLGFNQGSFNCPEDPANPGFRYHEYYCCQC